MSTIKNALDNVQQRIIQAAQHYHRDPHVIQLLAVSKTHPIEKIEEAIQWGQKCFGESYLQDALPKIQALQIYPDLEWHFIGAIQSNKTQAIAEHFSWVHSVANLKHAKRLNQQRPLSLPPLNICIQVNISQEAQKSGISLEDLSTLADEITDLSHLKLRGLMVLPAKQQDFLQQRIPFKKLRQAYESLQKNGLTLDTLSMGMTNDMEAAIAEGSTLVRVGTGIFGQRR